VAAVVVLLLVVLLLVVLFVLPVVPHGPLRECSSGSNRRRPASAFF